MESNVALLCRQLAQFLPPVSADEWLAHSLEILSRGHIQWIQKNRVA
ncbi:hypothetical protein [Moorena sp. SIO4G3]|nr:hypothetical protein [Moorena sp. SIO4G3]